MDTIKTQIEKRACLSPLGPSASVINDLADQLRATASPNTRIGFSPFFTTVIGQVVFSLYNSENCSSFSLFLLHFEPCSTHFACLSILNFKYNFSSREHFYLLKECLCQKP